MEFFHLFHFISLEWLMQEGIYIAITTVYPEDSHYLKRKPQMHEGPSFTLSHRQSLIFVTMDFLSGQFI